MNDWFNWVRLLFLIPVTVYGCWRAYRDLSPGHIGRVVVPWVAIYYVAFNFRPIAEDLGWIDPL